MFSGIVDHCGTLLEIRNSPNGLQFYIRSQFPDLVLGESISVNGICLTVAEVCQSDFRCDLSPETLKVTRAATYSLGMSLNLERALRLNDRVGGHFVTGHVDTVVTLVNKKKQGDFVELQFSNYPDQARSYLIPKGSIALNGVSLTINAILTDFFSVMLIPHTLARTNLLDCCVGEALNVEWDYLAKLVKRQVDLQNCKLR